MKFEPPCNLDSASQIAVRTAALQAAWQAIPNSDFHLLMLKIFFIALIVLSTYLERYMPGNYRWIASFGSAMWAASFIYLRDFWKAKFSKTSTPFYEKFYSQLSSELKGSLMDTVPVIFLAACAFNYYGSTSIDIALASFPFLAKSMSQLSKCRTLQIADHGLSVGIMRVLFFMLFSAYALFLWQLKEIFENNFTFFQSTWLQVSMLMTALYAFFGANLIRYILEEKKMEIPPTLLELLDHRRVEKIRNNMLEMVDVFNKHALAAQAAKQPKQKKKKRK